MTRQSYEETLNRLFIERQIRVMAIAEYNPVFAEVEEVFNITMDDYDAAIEDTRKELINDLEEVDQEILELTYAATLEPWYDSYSFDMNNKYHQFKIM
jgi:hypothetical protein